VARFSVRKLQFGRRPGADPDDDGEGLPTPAKIRLAQRRAAGIAEAKAVLQHLPEQPGESLHAITTFRMDLTDVIGHLLERFGVCELKVATLGFNKRNLRALLRFLDSGAVRSLALVASRFFYSHNGALWNETLEEFRRRGARAAFTDSHAKVCTMHFLSGEKFALEGSANLCGSGSAREQFALIRHDELTDWHAGWIDDLVSRHEGQATAQAEAH
jgi:hypothetical protein